MVTIGSLVTTLEPEVSFTQFLLERCLNVPLMKNMSAPVALQIVGACFEVSFIIIYYYFLFSVLVQGALVSCFSLFAVAPCVFPCFELFLVFSPAI